MIAIRVVGVTMVDDHAVIWNEADDDIALTPAVEAFLRATLPLTDVRFELAEIEFHEHDGTTS